MRYELWEVEGDRGVSVFFPAEKRDQHLVFDPQPRSVVDGQPMRLTWAVEADSWEDAQRARHEHRGWEPYQPFE